MKISTEVGLHLKFSKVNYIHNETSQLVLFSYTWVPDGLGF